MSNPDPRYDPEDINFEYDEFGVRMTPPSTFNSATITITTNIPIELYDQIVNHLAEKNVAREEAKMKRLTVSSLMSTLLEEWRDLMDVPL